MLRMGPLTGDVGGLNPASGRAKSAVSHIEVLTGLLFSMAPIIAFIAAELGNNASIKMAKKRVYQ